MFVENTIYYKTPGEVGFSSYQQCCKEIRNFYQMLLFRSEDVPEIVQRKYTLMQLTLLYQLSEKDSIKKDFRNVLSR